jgi:SAM-dependent methyltransferase
MELKRFVPWRAKFALKIALSRIPARYHLWQRLHVFRHGAMDDPAYALNVFRQHVKQSGFDLHRGYAALELGPGDSLFSALIVAATGGSRCDLVDVGAFAEERPAAYRAMAELLRREGFRPPAIDDAASLSEILARCNAIYRTRGLASVRELDDDSVDFVWSHAVLEHVRRADFLPLMRELRRVLRPGGVCSFRVDLQDHLGGSLNNLRFSERTWESDLIARSGFYTNRIRFREMLSLFEAAGFEAQVVQTDCWHDVPLRRTKMRPEFARLDDDDLKVYGFSIVLRPAVNSGLRSATRDR